MDKQEQTAEQILDDALNEILNASAEEENSEQPETGNSARSEKKTTSKSKKSDKPSEKTLENHTRISMLQNTDESMPMRVNVPSGRKQTPPRTMVFSDDSPKIRRMSDSTRAREIAKNSKKKKKSPSASQKPGEEYTYAKERPEGEYAYTQIHISKKPKNRKKVKRDTELTAAGTETIHLNLRDVVSVAQIPELEPVEPIEIEPAPRAETTSIDLTGKIAIANAGDLDVGISRSKEEAEAENRRRQEITDKMEMENVADIRSDIAELRSAINFRVFALTVVLGLSGFMALGDVIHTEWLDSLHPIMLAVLQNLLGWGAAVVCVPVLKNGFRRLASFRADTDSLAATALVACMVTNLVNLVTTIINNSYTPYFLPCAVLALLLHSVGKLLIVNRELTNLRLVTKRFNCYGMTIVENEQRAEALTRGVLGDFPILAAMRHTDSLIDFRKYTYSADMADHFCRAAAPMATLFSLAIAITMTILRAESISYCLMLLSMATSACSCAAITFVVNLPLLKATRRLQRNNGLLLGYQSVDDFYDTNSLMVDAASLFPDTSVRLSGIKMFTNTKMDTTIRTAASLAYHAGSVLSNALLETMQGKEKNLFKVENYVYEDSMGLCGWIHNQRVLLGNRELMTAHNIEGIPSMTREEELVGTGYEGIYLSISGNLSALFLVECHADQQVKFWARQTVRHNMCLLLRSVDPIITISRVSSLFDIPQESLKIIPQKMHDQYDIETAPVENMSASMASTGSFCSVAQLITATKVLRRTAAFGVFVQAVSILLGLGIVLMEAVLHVGLTPGWLLVTQCIAVLLTLLTVNIRRLY